MKYIACFGDSLIQGFPYASKYSWLTAAEGGGQLKMLNYGVCGDCCDDIFYRLRQYPLPEYVRHILFLGGANDLLQGRAYENILEDYRRLLQWCNEKQYDLCIVLPLISGDTAFNRKLLNLRQDVERIVSGKAFLLDLQPAIGLTDSERKAAYMDDLHPKSSTYAKMGEYAAPLLAKWVNAYSSI